MVYPSERYYRYLTSERTTTTVELLIWCQCYSNKIIITGWFFWLGNLIPLVLLMMQPFTFCDVYSIIILTLCSFRLCRVSLLTKCFVIGEKWLWNVLPDCFQLPGKSVFSEHKHARNVALKWLSHIGHPPPPPPVSRCILMSHSHLEPWCTLTQSLLSYACLVVSKYSVVML